MVIDISSVAPPYIITGCYVIPLILILMIFKEISMLRQNKIQVLAGFVRFPILPPILSRLPLRTGSAHLV